MAPKDARRALAKAKAEAKAKAAARGAGPEDREEALAAGGAAGPEPAGRAYTARLKRIVEDINRNRDVEGLCRGFLTRIAKLVDNKGGRLSE